MSPALAAYVRDVRAMLAARAAAEAAERSVRASRLLLLPDEERELEAAAIQAAAK